MTHDELITYIDDSTNGLKHEHLFEKLLANTKALRAVVELHKPYQHEVVSYVFCMGCTIDLDLAPPYPCETIQAIEKELQ
jgi:hypothetical protein